MAVSGTYNFNLDIDEVIQEASEMIGGESTLANEAASARRSINLMLRIGRIEEFFFGLQVHLLLLLQLQSLATIWIAVLLMLLRL